MAWQDNAIMFWSSDGGSTWNKISDHGRDPLDITYERIGTSSRMVDGTMRRQSVAKKRTFSTSWNRLPSKIAQSYGGRTGMGTVDGGWAGEEIENFYKTVDGAFKIKLRKGNDEAKAITDGTLEVVDVFFADFSKSIDERGIIDYWSLSISLEEV